MGITITNADGTSAETAADEIRFRPEVYRNEVAIATSGVPQVAYGQLEIESPQIQTTLECVVLGWGAVWNEGTPTFAHGEILGLWANGHAPTAEHPELGNKCRFVYHGVEENPSTSPFAWASPEPPLQLVNQEGVVCAESGKKELSRCREESERIHDTVTREVSREALTVPWNLDYTEKNGSPYARLGLPDECKGRSGSARTELSKCPEASEREAGQNPEGCNIPPTPAPPGCVKVEILSNPPLNVHQEYEGHLEPLMVNSGPSGLAPASWEFEGHTKGEPGLHLRETPTAELSATGSLKLLGYQGQELITVK